MNSLWVPRQVKEKLVAERQELDADTDLLVDHEVHRRMEAAERFDVELRRIDPYLRLRYIRKPPGWPDDVESPEPGIVLDRWHVIRYNPDAPPTFMAITTPDGGYRDPDSGVLEDLSRADAWSTRSLDRAAKRRARVAAEKQRDNDRHREALKDELVERVRAANHAQVSLASGWTNRAGARRDVRS